MLVTNLTAAYYRLDGRVGLAPSGTATISDTDWGSAELRANVNGLLRRAAAKIDSPPTGYVIADDGTIADPTSRTAAAGVLASARYDPGTRTQKTIDSATAADLDSANLAATFVAPASGVVIVRLSALAGADGAVNGYWLVRENAVEVARSSAGFYTAAVGDTRVTVELKITGLAPGSVHTYTWGHVSNASGQPFKTTYGDTGGGNPAVIEVLAA